MNFQNDHYLVGISDCKVVAKIQGKEVFGVTDATMISFRDTENLDLLEKQNLEKSLLEVRRWLSTNFYFSRDYNLTTALHEQRKASPSLAEMWMRADKRFFWNR